MTPLSYRQIQKAFVAGDRVQSFETMESYPHYMVRSGAVFTVKENDLANGGRLRLHLDDPGDLLAGDLQEWENCLEFWGPDQDGLLSHEGVGDDDHENPGHALNLPIFPLQKVEAGA